METKKITIHAALGELKKLKQRIAKSTTNATFVGSMKNSSDIVSGTSHSVEKFGEIVNADYQSVNDMIDNAEAIKSLIVKSNAVTEVQVGKAVMTVAEAIEKKGSISLKKELLSRMKRQYQSAVVNVTTYNERVEENLDAQVTALSGKDGSGKANLSGYMEEYRKQNGWKVIDPLNIKDKITALEDEIFDFETNVDVALSVSNATTFIEI